MAIADSKIRTGQFVIDPENNQLTFLDMRFYATEDGDMVPSVSTILDAYPKPAAFYQWLKDNTAEESERIKTEAGETGSMVHQLSEQYDLGETVSMIDANGKIRYKAKEWSLFERYVAWCREFNPEIVQTEFNIVSPKLGTGGTVDKEIILDDMNLMIDLKTSNQINDTYWMQLAAYAKMFEERTGRLLDIAILWVNAKTRTTKYEKGKTYQIPGVQLLFPPRELEHYWKLFKHCQVLWNEVNGDMKPREITYNLSHKK